MNKAFKVLWNDVRRTYVVSSEAQMSHGKPTKSAKTLVAAAVAGVLALGAGSALAASEPLPETITNASLSDLGTTKFHSGNGQTVNIQTEGDARALAQALLSGDMKAIRVALGHNGTYATMVGTAGGTNLMDSTSYGLITLANTVALKDPSIEKLLGQFEQIKLDSDKNLAGNTSIVIGGESKNPLVVATVGGDRVLNARLVMSDSTTGGAIASVVRKGDSSIVMNSGNSLLMTGASSAVNVGDIATVSKSGIPFFGTVNVTPSAEETNVKLDGNSSIQFLGTSSSAGTFVGGSAVALGGKATSTVTGSSNLTIETTPNAQGFEGLHLGAIGGGLAVGVAGGNAVSSVEQETNINLNSGMVAGVIGGGVGLSSDLTDLWDVLEDRLGNYKDNIAINEEAIKAGAESRVESGDISINVNGDTTVAALMGGGVAIANAGNHETVSKSHAVTGNVAIKLGDETTKVISGKEKGELVSAAKEIVSLIKNGGEGFDFDKASELINKLNKPGVHVATLGGGIAAAKVDHPDATAHATAEVGNVGIQLNGGYNVGTMAGGIATLFVNGRTDATAITPDVASATSKAQSTYVEINGGENVLVAGGGASYATGTNGIGSTGLASATVDSATLVVNKGSVDGLFGGGVAVDDTSAAEKNAEAITKTVAIQVNGGTVSKANLAVLDGIAVGVGSGAPSNGSYVHETLDLIDSGEVAILGAGMATGGGALAHTDSVLIDLKGGSVEGNVFAGGAATLGAESTVTKAVVNVDGSSVNGNIYGGGLAGSERNDNYDSSYVDANSLVKEVAINLVSGEVTGDIYAGGMVRDGATKATSTVEKANVMLLKSDVFKGKKIDATGVTGDATLAFANDDYDLNGATVTGFNKVQATGHVENFNFDFGEKIEATFSGIFDVAELTADKASTLTVADSGVLAISKTPLANVSFNVTNGVLALGDSANAKTAYEELSSVQGIPGLYLSGQVDLRGTNALIGDAKGDGVVIGSNGTLMADAGVGTTVDGTIQGTTSSEIYFTNVATEGASVVFDVDGLKDFDLTSNITVDNVRYEVLKNEGTFTFAQITNGDKLRRLGLDGFDSDALAAIETQDDDASRHIRSMLDQQNTSITSGDHRHAQLNAAFNLATAAGVQTAGIEGALLGLDQAAKRASLTNTFADGWTGFAEVTGTQVEMGGSRGMLESKTKLGGLAAGGEYTTGDWTFGALMNLGTGEVKGQGHNASVKNDVDFYGLQGYAAKRLGNFNVVGQAGWMMSKNDIKHGMGDTADVDANVYTVGARGEMSLALTQSVTMVPYVGVNYLRVDTDGYTTKKGFKVEEVNQDLINVPVGVAVTGDFGNMAGWQMKPVADVAYVHTFGDTNVEADTGVGAATMATDLDVWSENVARVRFGMQAQKDNVSVGFTLGGATGSDDHKEVYGQINAKYVF